MWLLVHGTTVTEEHQNIVRRVLQILADNKLLLYSKKYKFHQMKVKYYKGDWGTRLQENPQLILQFVIMIQLISRRILRD